MRPGQWLRKIWHDIYYAVSGAAGDALALTCREATLATDVAPTNRFRYWLHLSVCQACQNYYDFSAFLNKNRNASDFKQMSPEEIKDFNRKLLASFRR